jgi:DNA modification methylase
MALTDPPYNVAYGSHGGAPKNGRRRVIQNGDLGQGFYDFLLKACHNLLSITDGSVYICISSSELHTLQRAFTEVGGHWSTFIIWAKDTFTLGRSDYQRQYEPILYGWREGIKHHWCGDRDQGDVWSFPKPLVSTLHPTMKPVPLVQRAIENSSQPADVVLDLFLGSGSSLIGCEHTGRVCYGIELEPEYVDVAVIRWEAFTGEKARREGQ